MPKCNADMFITYVKVPIGWMPMNLNPDKPIDPQITKNLRESTSSKVEKILEKHIGEGSGAVNIAVVKTDKIAKELVADLKKDGYPAVIQVGGPELGDEDLIIVQVFNRDPRAASAYVSGWYRGKNIKM